jgi:hypothetical protein
MAALKGGIEPAAVPAVCRALVDRKGALCERTLLLLPAGTPVAPGTEPWGNFAAPESLRIIGVCIFAVKET